MLKLKHELLVFGEYSLQAMGYYAMIETLAAPTKLLNLSAFGVGFTIS